MDNDKTAGEQMVEDLGMAPALDVDDNQRAELLREWHHRDAEADAKKKRPKER